jgi:hypothetical protein
MRAQLSINVQTTEFRPYRVCRNHLNLALSAIRTIEVFDESPGIIGTVLQSPESHHVSLHDFVTVGGVL